MKNVTVRNCTYITIPIIRDFIRKCFKIMIIFYCCITVLSFNLLLFWNIFILVFLYK
jgi:hypothetical protein